MNTNTLSTSISFIKIIIVITSFSGFLSCDKDDTNPYIENSTNFIDSIDYNTFANYDDVIGHIRYNYEFYTFQLGTYWSLSNTLTGEYETNTWYEMFPFQGFYYSSTLNTVMNVWNCCYQSINISNLFLSDTHNSTDNDVITYKGQAYFYRALSYYTLIKYFGKYYPYEDYNAAGVPIISSDNTQNITRASIQEVYDQIIHDLDNAASCLPDPGSSAENNTTKYSALALAAETHIWFGQYEKALLLLEQIIQSGYFNLMNRYSDNFDGLHENNSESLFEFQYFWGGEAWNYSRPYEPAQYYSTFLIQFRDYSVTEPVMIKLGDDPRAKETYYSFGDTMINSDGQLEVNETYNTYAKKYAHVVKPYGDYYGNNLVLIRLSDIYLLYSEALIRTGNLSEAITYINMVKARAGADLITDFSFSANELMDILRAERFNELCGEGSYWFDMIRWNLAESEFSARGFIKGKNEALPIPQTIIDNNPGIQQNEGY